MTTLDPNQAYRERGLWLPKKKLKNLGGLKSALTVEMGGSYLKVYEDTKDFLVVPREFLSSEELERLGIEVLVPDIEFQELATRPQVNSEPRDEIQIEGISAMQGKNGILSVACGRGKTFMTLKSWADQPRVSPLLVVVNQNNLLTQWTTEIQEHTSIRKEDIGIVQGGKFNWEHPITLASVQTLSTRVSEGRIPEDFHTFFGTTVYEEVHHMAAASFLKTADISLGQRWGLSATPDREDGKQAIYQYHIGPILYQNLELDLAPETFFIYTGVTAAPREMEAMCVGENINSQLLNGFLSGHSDRAELVDHYIGEMVGKGRKILVLSPLKERCNAMHKKWSGSGLLTGDVNVDTRMEDLRTKNLLFATTQMAREALNRKDLDTLFIDIPFKAKGMFQQAIGRILRECPGKQIPYVFIFEDEEIRTTHRWCNTLRAWLTSWGYDFKIIR